MIIISLLLLMCGCCLGDTTPEEKEEIESLNELKTLKIFGDSIAIVSKNETSDQTDSLDEYLHSHVIRIKSPLGEDKHYDFELKDLIPEDDVEGRKKRRPGILRMLIPLLIALKIKHTIVIPIFMMMIAFLAVKGFWAGITSLIISKALAIKVYQKKDKDEEDEPEDSDEYHEHYYNHEPYEVPHGHSHHGDTKPIVIYMNSEEMHDKIHQGFNDHSIIHHNPAGHHHWDRYSNLRSKWPKEPNWERSPWRVLGQT